MKAIVYETYGTADVLQLKELEKPVPGDKDIRIQVHAAEATKADVEMRSFRFAVKWFWLPLRLALGVRKPRRQVLGGYFSGVVDEVGKDVSEFSKGDQVFGSAGLKMGAYGEYMVLPSTYTITAKPSNMHHVEAAAVPLGGLNALHFMRLADVKPGDEVLINGAGGSIGTHAIQIAKSMGGRVTAVDSAIKETVIRQLGADRFIDYTSQNVMSSGHTFDVIFDMVATSSLSGYLRLLKPKGRYLTANPRLSVMLRSVFLNKFSKKSVNFAFAGETREELKALKTLIEDGSIKTVLDTVFPMEQAVEAHRRVETEQRLGAVVIAIGDKGVP